MIRKTLLAGILCAAIVSPGLAAPKVGERAPQIGAAYWWNLPKGMKKLDLSDLRGQIVLLDFWGTWCDPCRASVPHLKAIHQKYASKGVVIVGLSDEKRSPVDAFVRDLKVPYIIGSGAKATQNEYAIKAWPTMVIIGPDGMVEWIGNPNDADFDKTFETILKEKPPKTKAKFDKVSAKAAYDKAEKLFTKEKYAEALKAFDQVAEEFKDTKWGKKAKEKAADIRDDPKLMAKVRAAQEKSDCENWLAMARSFAKKGKKGEAVEYYDRVIKEYPDSEYARTAEEEKAKLKA